jgi:hypothetical protein
MFEVAGYRTEIIVRIRSLVSDEVVDFTAIVLVNVGLFEEFHLVLELPRVALDVICVNHRIYIVGCWDYKDMASNPGGTIRGSRTVQTSSAIVSPPDLQRR